MPRPQLALPWLAHESSTLFFNIQAVAKLKGYHARTRVGGMNVFNGYIKSALDVYAGFCVRMVAVQFHVFDRPHLPLHVHFYQSACFGHRSANRHIGAAYIVRA